MDYRYLKELFCLCIEADYCHTEEEGSFSALRDGEVLYLLFEKSRGGEDWINNLSYRAERADGEDTWYCHEGFLSVWRSILPYIKNLISDPDVKRIVTVGYSHGAALAVLCQEYIWRMREDIARNCEGFGFGCPRVVYGIVPNESERWRNFYVIRNIDDIVTHLPPRTFGYRHVGNLIEIGKRGKYSDIDAHREENYIEELENLSM